MPPLTSSMRCPSRLFETVQTQMKEALFHFAAPCPCPARKEGCSGRIRLPHAATGPQLSQSTRNRYIISANPPCVEQNQGMILWLYEKNRLKIKTE